MVRPVHRGPCRVADPYDLVVDRRGTVIFAFFAPGECTALALMTAAYPTVRLDSLPVRAVELVVCS